MLCFGEIAKGFAYFFIGIYLMDMLLVIGWCIS